MQGVLNNLSLCQAKTETDGFAITEGIYQPEEIKHIIKCIEAALHQNPNFRTGSDLFAIRNLLHEIPEVSPLIWNDKLRLIIEELFGADFFCVKSIFFDKPPLSNWLVAWHQDLMISVDKKQDTPGFGPWTTKHKAYHVQPPRALLESMYTIRIHLDDCNHTNGALRIIPGSHQSGILTPRQVAEMDKTGVSCHVKQGGVMVMKPLLLHSSAKSISPHHRRVIHLEFSNQSLPAGLAWQEAIHFQTNHSNA